MVIVHGMWNRKEEKKRWMDSEEDGREEVEELAISAILRAKWISGALWQAMHISYIIDQKDDSKAVDNQTEITVSKTVFKDEQIRYQGKRHSETWINSVLRKDQLGKWTPRNKVLLNDNLLKEAYSILGQATSHYLQLILLYQSNQISFEFT